MAVLLPNFARYHPVHVGCLARSRVQCKSNFFACLVCSHQYHLRTVSFDSVLLLMVQLSARVLSKIAFYLLVFTRFCLQARTLSDSTSCCGWKTYRGKR